MKQVIGYFLLACVFCSAGLLYSAQERSAAKDRAKAAQGQNITGVAFIRQKLFKEAVASFREALATDPSFRLARVNLGIALFYDQDLDGALQILARAEAEEPDNPYILFTLGLVHKNKGESDRAVDRFDRVIQIDPKCSASHYNLGVLYGRQGKEKEAEAALRRALELDPNQAGALYSLGNLLVKTGHREEGNRLLERFRSLRQKSTPQSGMGSGVGYGDLGKYALARE